MRRQLRAPLSVLLVAAMAVSLLAAETAPDTAGPPTDYIAQAEQGVLSQPDYPDTVRESFNVAMDHDGTEIYVEVVRPDPGTYGDLDIPVVMEISPYHGTLGARNGTRIFPGHPEGLTGYFAPRGYAVAMVDLRGTGRSGGCLDHLGPNDAADLKEIVEWAADPERAWNGSDLGKVGITGHSYVGSTPSVAAAQNPKGLATIVPSAGLASMYDHQFQMGVPYFLQWAGPQWAYPWLATVRHLPPVGNEPVQGANTGDNFGNSGPEEIACGFENSAFTAGHGQVTGEYQQWHAERDWREPATEADIPVWIIHGVNDNAARIPAAEWFFGDRFDRSEDKVWIGQWDHGSGAHLNGRFDQWTYGLHAWFDKHLKGMDVDTGPAVEAFLGGGNEGPVYTADAWTQQDSAVTLYPDASDMTLSTTPPEGDSSVSFQGAAGTSRGSVTFASEPFEEDSTILGLPDLDLHASVTGQSMHLVTILWRVTEFGTRLPMNFCAINPQLREGVDSPAPIVPGEEMELEPQCFTMAHQVPEGSVLELEVNTTSEHHAPLLAVDAMISVYTGPDKTAYSLPHVDDAVLYDDVPSLREE